VEVGPGLAVDSYVIEPESIAKAESGAIVRVNVAGANLDRPETVPDSVCCCSFRLGRSMCLVASWLCYKTLEAKLTPSLKSRSSVEGLFRC
jgi:hypothetical protein